jgi:putative spermidine/putrescine transport system permease protein
VVSESGRGADARRAAQPPHRTHTREFRTADPISHAKTMLPRWVTAVYLAYLAAPIVLLVVGSFGELWLNSLLPTGATLHWYANVAADPSFRRAFGVSLLVAVLTCAACVGIGLPLAYAVFRAESPRVRAAARVLYQLPVALPALVLAFGFILVFSSDTLPWLGSLWLLVAGHIVLGLPYFLQTVVADMQRLGLRAQEDAAESLGSTGVQRFVHIVLPALRHSVLSGLIIVAALSIGEFQFSNLVAGFLNRTYPVVLLQAFYGATGFACAATVVLLALALTASVAGALTTRGAAGATTGAQLA